MTFYHLQAEHPQKPLFYCEPCRLCVTTERAIHRHREVVHEGRVRFLCGLCMTADYNRFLIKQIMRVLNKTQSTIRSLCNFITCNRFAIQRHLDKRHSDVEDRARYLVDLVNEWPEYYELRKRQEA